MYAQYRQIILLIKLIMITLQKFTEADIPRLIGWIPDARFLLQWAGPQYKFPLDANQIVATLEKTKGEKPPHLMFKAIQQEENVVVGHIELMLVDYEKMTAILGRVLIGGAENRGKGWGSEMVAEALKYGFDMLRLRQIKLNVFDFNSAAISCYKNLGFTQYEFCPNARQSEQERWNLIRMKIDKKTWRSGKSRKI